MVVPEKQAVREYDRTVLLERIEREGSTIGASMPISLSVDGTEYTIREEVLALVAADELSQSQRDRAGELARVLRRARRQRHDRLSSGECDRETGEDLVAEIAGIDRALNALKQLDAPGIAQQAQQRERADQERWLQFLKEALGHDEGQR